MILDAENATTNRLEDSQSSSVTSLQITQTERLQRCLTLFGTGCLGPCPRRATGPIFSLSLLTVCLREVIACLNYLFDFTV